MNATNPSFVGPDVNAAREFTRHLVDLLRKEHGAMVNFLLALSECDGRRLWADLGYASLFDYLHRELGLSRSAAYYRTAATSLVQRYPEIADALADGRLCLTSLAEISKVITPGNAAEILPRFFHRSSREAKEVVAAINPNPAPPRREVVTLIGPKATKATSAALDSRIDPCCTVDPRIDPSQARVQALGQIELGRVDSGRVATHVSPEPAIAVVPSTATLPAPEPVTPASRQGEEIQYLTADLRRFHLTVTKRWLEKLQTAKDALSHSIPSGDGEAVLEAALDALLEREAKKRGLLVKNPRKPRGSTATPPMPTPSATGSARKRRRKNVPVQVQREVLRRDEGRCQARLHDGTICGSTVRLQLDHVHPDSLGGSSTVDNLRVLCASHNQLSARRVFGEERGGERRIIHATAVRPGRATGPETVQPFAASGRHTGPTAGASR